MHGNALQLYFDKTQRRLQRPDKTIYQAVLVKTS